MIYQEATCIEELLEQYEDTLKRTKQTIKEIELEIHTFESVCKNENYSLEWRMNAEERLELSLHNKSIYSSIKNDLEYTIHWMKTGHQPENKRGIERKAAYEREKPFDPLIMQRFFRSEETTYSWDKSEKESCLSFGEKNMISAALSILTEKEKELYLMSRGYCLSFTDIAKNIGVSRQTVQATVKRAEKKIATFIKKNKEEEGNEYRTAN